VAIFKWPWMICQLGTRAHIAVSITNRDPSGQFAESVSNHRPILSRKSSSGRKKRRPAPLELAKKSQLCDSESENHSHAAGLGLRPYQNRSRGRRKPTAVGFVVPGTPSRWS
jgi:hypothetical protein